LSERSLHCRPSTNSLSITMSDLVRAGSVGKGGLGGVGRQTRVEKPRPLKMSGGTQPELRPEDLVVVVENVIKGLANRQYDEQMVGQVRSLCANLKRSGAQMECTHKDPMDRLLSALVAACRDDSLDLVCRVHMLEIIELRSMGWQTNENVTNYYKQKLAQIDTSPPRPQTAPVQLNPSAPDFNPEKKDSASFLATKASLSSMANTRKSFELPTTTNSGVPRALGRPRGSNIRPPLVGEGGDSQTDLTASSNLVSNQSVATLVVGQQQLTISGVSPELVRTAKIVLHEFFNVCGGTNGASSVSVSEDSNMESPPPERDLKTGARSKNCSGESSVSSVEDDGPQLILVKPELSYEKAELMQLAKSPLCKATPDRWSELVADLPGVVRRADRAGPTSKLILREMEEIRRQEAAPKFQ